MKWKDLKYKIEKEVGTKDSDEVSLLNYDPNKGFSLHINDN